MIQNTTKSEKFRLRFAPSPTGLLHLGNARTAIFNYLFAKKNKGELVLRIEDTDVQRNTPEGEKDIMESLKWLGIEWQEGPDIGGPHGPYKQSERLAHYQNSLVKLIQNGRAYRCFCSAERLEGLRKDAETQKKPFQYDRHCRGLSEKESEELAKNKPFVVRLKIPEGRGVEFRDLIRGPIKFSAGMIDDFVISKGMNLPLYHLAVVVDDAEMEISHVIRGEDHLSNTPKHIFLQEALNVKTPQYAHLPLILDEHKKKLSKRAGNLDMFVSTLKNNNGFLSEAVFNGLALLGWNSKTEQEVFTREELISRFDLKNVQKSGAVFSADRLIWLNKQHMKNLPDEKISSEAKIFLDKELVENNPDKFLRFISVEKTRISFFSEIGDLFRAIIDTPLLDPHKIAWKESTANEAKKALNISAEGVEKLPDDDWASKEALKSSILNIADQSGMGRAALLWPFRYCLSGREKSAGPDELAWILGKTETLKRLNNGIKLLD